MFHLLQKVARLVLPQFKGEQNLTAALSRRRDDDQNGDSQRRIEREDILQHFLSNHSEAYSAD